MVVEPKATAEHLRGPVLDSFPLYSERCQRLLQQALLQSKPTTTSSTTGQQNPSVRSTGKSNASTSSLLMRYASSSSSSEEEGDSNRSGTDEDDEDDSFYTTSQTERPGRNATSELQTSLEQIDLTKTSNSGKESSTISDLQMSPPLLKTKKQAAVTYAQRKQLDALPCTACPLVRDDGRKVSLEFPSAILSKEASRLLAHSSDTADDDEGAIWQRCQAFADVSRRVSFPPNNKPSKDDDDFSNVMIVLCLRSGRFAGAVFSHDRVLAHTTSSRYTVRKGQGKAQSAQDGSRRPQSMGAQLRRQGEIQLKQDVAATLEAWKDYVEQAALVWVSIPKTMQQDVYGTSSSYGCLRKDDSRLRKIPLDVGRPTFEAVCHVHAIVTTVTLRGDVGILQKSYDDTNKSVLVDSIDDAVLVTAVTTTDRVNIVTDKKESTASVIIPLTALHEACRIGNVEEVRRLIQTEDVNARAGEFYMTPLHHAAAAVATGSEATAQSVLTTSRAAGDSGQDNSGESIEKSVSPDKAAECVHRLLVDGHANPCVLDNRNRVPYFLATTDVVRQAFRRARADLGEDCWEWDAMAKVGPPVTSEDLARQKEAQAAKRRRKKARQKDKKAQEKAEVLQAEAAKSEEKAQEEQRAEAKRIRDGLAAKPIASKTGQACDYCQTVCQGRKRTQMLKRLSYSYCRTECVQQHKRELMAAAAAARFGG